MKAPKVQRLVHYVAHGSGGLAFDCYYRESRASQDSAPRTLTGYKLKLQGMGYQSVEPYPSIPPPLRHTDLRHVTCRECWTHIRNWARARLAPTVKEA